MVSAVVEGLGLRHLGNPELVDADFRGPASITLGADESGWRLPALALVAILEGFLEPDPDYDAEAAVAALRELKRQRAGASDSEGPVE